MGGAKIRSFEKDNTTMLKDHRGR